jgi:hypothetical protein
VGTIPLELKDARFLFFLFCYRGGGFIVCLQRDLLAELGDNR